MALDTSQFRNGLKIELDGEPFTIVYFQHVKPGKGGAFVRTKVKNLKTGRVLDRRFRSGEKVQAADIEDRKMQYLYQDGDLFYFMNKETFDQTPLNRNQVGDAALYLAENGDCDLLAFGDEPIGLEVPAAVVLTVADTEPGIKGDTAQGATKQAKMETGLIVLVPLFVNNGEKLKINTRNGEYLERA